MSQEQRIDLAPKQLGLLKKIIKQHIPNKTVWAYGSRVIWKANEVSDIDLTVFDCTNSQIDELKETLVESNLLISVDVMNWKEIPDNFKMNIKKQYVVLQEKKKLKGWREVKLGDVAAKLGDGLHGTPKYDDNGEYYFINGSNLNNGKIVIKGNTRKTSGNEYKKYNKELNDRTILVSINGTLGNIALYNDEKCLLGKSVCYFNVKEDIDKSFIKYVVVSTLFQKYINIFANGTTIKNVSLETMREYYFSLPPLPEQKAIAEVLSSLDDKIDLLHRQNTTLEGMAQTLFRQWFVEQADESWEKKPLDKVADYLNGLACQKYPAQNELEKLPVLKIKELRSGFTEDSDWVTSKVDGKYIIEFGDVIFSWSGSLMLKIWNGQNCVLNQHLFKVTSKEYPKWFYYFWTKHHLEKFIAIANSKATTMGHIKREDLTGSLVLVPASKELSKMNEQIKPMFEKIFYNQKQIRTLENLRNTLLPKLMNGEVMVKQ